MPHPRCPRCGLTRVIPGPGSVDCPDCHAWPAALRRAASACLHEGVAGELVRGLKYRGWTGLTRFMGDAMLPAARHVAGEAEPVLVPVPLTRARRRERGFNQAELLALALSARTGWTVSHLLVRRTGGRAQARLGRRDRQDAVVGAYGIAPGVERSLSRGSPALIVDDVITTGSTGIACAEALIPTGARCLGIVSFSRADPLEERS